jgi:hypothetical protein
LAGGLSAGRERLNSTYHRGCGRNMSARANVHSIKCPAADSFGVAQSPKSPLGGTLGIIQST